MPRDSMKMTQTIQKTLKEFNFKFHYWLNGLLNVITLGQTISDTIYQTIAIDKYTSYTKYASIERYLRLVPVIL